MSMKKGLALAFGVALGGVILWGNIVYPGLGSTSAPEPSSPEGNAARGGSDLVENFCGGEVSDLQAVDRAAPYDLLVPATGGASVGTVRIVYWCPNNNAQVAVEFESGIRLQMERAHFEDPLKAWQQIVDAYPDAGYSIQTVRGEPALTGTPGGPFGLTGGVEWIEAGVQITVTGDKGIALEELLGVAESLEPF